ncbi:MAG TPA: DUF222 domain-containing protein [Acidimicrobiales bacterium]|nr:DUF222 domain-containing protein [Acidimicrobiales bacterium]
MAITALAEALDELVAADPACLADAESVEELQRQLSRLEAVVARATSAFDERGDWAADGARNAVAWVATRCRIPKSHARRRLRLGRRVASLPLCQQAWLNGEVSGSHVELITAVSREATAEALERDQALLVGHARTLRFDLFARALRYWASLADPDGVEVDHDASRARRDVYLESSFQGMWLGRITLDPVAGAIVAGELERLELAHFDADRAEAAERLGRDPGPYELARTPGQRRADALVEMATRSRTAPADGQRPVPLFSVFVGYETLHGRICELAQGMAVSPGSLVPWIERAEIERAVFRPVGRVEVSAKARLFTGATRRAIELRDRECTHPYCDRPAYRCEADHILPYSLGGPTTQENGRLLCGYHNRLRNARPPPD